MSCLDDENFGGPIVPVRHRHSSDDTQVRGTSGQHSSHSEFVESTVNRLVNLPAQETEKA
jgi:hypothetical protein